MQHGPQLRKLVAVGASASLMGVALSVTTGEAVAKEDGRLKAVRAWTDQYRSESAAIADGFLRTDVCVPNMGYHYVNPARVDGRLQPSKPEIVIYAPGPNGTRVLAGVEWVVVDADQSLLTDDDRPKIFNIPLEGPMPGHGTGMPIHYDRHAWAWLENPNGGFAMWNTRVVCP